MKILICSLQVSLNGSKGHLHPALELGLALKKRGHEISLLPLPSSLNQQDTALVKQCGFNYVSPPPLPPGLPLPANKLAELAKDPATTFLAYQSFLIAPLTYQFDALLQYMACLWRRYYRLRFVSLCSAFSCQATWHS